MTDRDQFAQSPPDSGSSRPINGEAPERQSPASDCGGGQPLDDTRPDNGEATGGRGHFPFSRTDSQEQTCPYVVGKTTLHCSLTPPTLTDEERAAIEQAVKWYDNMRAASTLRALLERLK